MKSRTPEIADRKNPDSEIFHFVKKQLSDLRVGIQPHPAIEPIEFTLPSDAALKKLQEFSKHPDSLDTFGASGLARAETLLAEHKFETNKLALTQYDIAFLRKAPGEALSDTLQTRYEKFIDTHMADDQSHREEQAASKRSGPVSAKQLRTLLHEQKKAYGLYELLENFDINTVKPSLRHTAIFDETVQRLENYSLAPEQLDTTGKMHGKDILATLAQTQEASREMELVAKYALMKEFSRCGNNADARDLGEIIKQDLKSWSMGYDKLDPQREESAEAMKKSFDRFQKIATEKAEDKSIIAQRNR